MGKVTTTFITTCLNEEQSIEKFLSSLYKQTKLPDEVIIVDGGSTDATLDLIQKAKIKSQNFKLKLKIIVRKGNRSVGRNMAIESSTSDVIACSDVGCELSVNWFERIVRPFEDRHIDVVAGFYKGNPQTVFQKCVVPYVLVMSDRLNVSTFLPATRSIAFRKSAWEKVGGFNEKYSHNEDYVFAKSLQKEQLKIEVAQDAVVYWKPRENLRQFFIMCGRFAYGDAEARIYRPKVVLVFARYILGVGALAYVLISKNYDLISIIVIFLVLYTIWAIWKNYKYVKNIRALYILPMLQFVSDVAVMGGTIRGLLKF